MFLYAIVLFSTERHLYQGILREKLHKHYAKGSLLSLIAERSIVTLNLDPRKKSGPLVQFW